MPTTYPLPTLAAQITATGVSVPAYADILASLQAEFKLIFGDDAYLGADSQDGQLLAVFAQAIHDCNMATLAVYNSFSPQTAVGVGLSNVVKINHMRRQVPTKSQVNVTLTGVNGTTITNGQVADTEGNRWLLPSSVTIPPGGSIVVTAQAEKAGAIGAPIGAVNRITTPVAGWQGVTNASAASPGLPVESDAALRFRQTQAPALSSYTVLQGIAAAINALPGVTYGKIYENDTGSTDSNGLPAHSIAVVVKGGVAQSIAETIYAKKAPGVATHGSTTVTIVDVAGVNRDIKFTVPAEIPIKATVTLTPSTGYTTAIAESIKAAVAAHVNALKIGEDVVVNRLMVPALLNGAPESLTYVVVSVQAGLVSGSVGSSDVVITYTNKATMLASNVTITVV